MKFRIFLVVASCAVSVITGFVLSRGGSTTESVKARAKPLIGLSMDTLKEERWQGDRNLFVARATELGADVLVQSANSDDTRQIGDVQALISRRVDVLVIVPHNGGAMAKAVNMAHDAGTVLAYDRLITDCDLDLYMTFDNIKVGELQAQFLVDHFPKGGKKKNRSYLRRQDRQQRAPLQAWTITWTWFNMPERPFYRSARTTTGNVCLRRRFSFTIYKSDMLAAGAG
jgi:D-xylose transport system substrate-binding protein